MKNKKICALVSLALLTTSAAPAFAATVTPSITAGDVTIVNNFVGTKDTITLKGADFKSGDVIKVYNNATKTTTLGTATADGTADVVISVDQVGQAAGSAYVTNTTSGDTESAPVAVAFTQEQTPVIDASKVTVTNNVDKADTVAFTGLTAGEVVKVYAKGGTTAIGTGTASSTGAATVTLTAQISESDLELEVSGTAGKASETSKTAVTYAKQVVSADPSATVTNNVDKLDTVTFTGVKKGDKGIVYAKGTTTILGSAVALADGSLTVTLAKQLSETDLGVDVALKTPNQMLSATKSVTYSKQVVSATPSATVTNNVDKLDTVTFTGVKKGDKGIVYAKGTTTILGSAVALADGNLTVTLAKQLSETDLGVDVALKTPNQMLSATTSVTYSKQVVSADPSATVTNNVDKLDTVTFASVKKGDKGTVYAKDGVTILGSGVALADGDLTVTLAKQLSETDLEVEAALKTPNEMLSAKKAVTYSTQAITTAPLGLDVLNGDGTVKTAGDTVVTNNVDFADKVTVKGLKAKDVVTVYGSDAKAIIGKAVALKDGDVTVTLTKQLDETNKKAYVTVKNYNKMASDQTELDYTAQAVTASIDSTKMLVTNNAVIVTGLTAGDKVSVYSTVDGTVPVATATVAAGNTYAVVANIKDVSGKTLYVANKSKNQMQSTRSTITFQ